MGSFASILPNARSRLIARTDVTTRWSTANVTLVSPDSSEWPLHQYGCRLSIQSTNISDSMLVRGLLRADVGHWTAGDEARDSTMLNAGLLQAVEDVIVALQHSFLNAALDEPLVLRTISSVRGVSREEVNAEGWGVSQYAEFSFGVILPTAYLAPLDGGTGVDRGGAA